MERRHTLPQNAQATDCVTCLWLWNFASILICSTNAIIKKTNEKQRKDIVKLHFCHFSKAHIKYVMSWNTAKVFAKWVVVTLFAQPKMTYSRGDFSLFVLFVYTETLEYVKFHCYKHRLLWLKLWIFMFSYDSSWALPKNYRLIRWSHLQQQ